jgi:hypothetical protein
MRASDRTVSSIVATIFVLVFAIEFLFDKALVPAKTVAEPGVVQFNVCTMWEQIPATVRLSTIVSFVTTFVLLVQGLRNRSVPRWLAALCLVAPFPSINHDYWQRQECYTKFSGDPLLDLHLRSSSDVPPSDFSAPANEKGGPNEPPQGNGGMTPPTKL